MRLKEKNGMTDMKKSTWIIIDPIDTLFFRGAESMEAGENHEVDTMFPPMPQTIIGAIRTAVLVQKDIAPKDYLSAPERHPFLGPPETPGFSLVGPLFLANGETFLLPAPANWFADLPEEGTGGIVVVQAAWPLKRTFLALKGSTPAPFWVQNPESADLKPLAGYWTTAASFRQMVGGRAEIPVLTDAVAIEKDQAALLPPSALFDQEERLGIALTAKRTSKDGHLYTSVHVRMRPGVELAAGIVSNYDLPLDEFGIIQLGGEQRLCRYRLRGDMVLPEGSQNGTIMALSLLPLDRLPEYLRQCPRASGKILRIGGWDMRDRFHKPMRAWLPAGTVFVPKAQNSEKNIHFIAI